MANFIINDIKKTFNSNDALTQIIIANVIVFIVVNLLDAFAYLGKLGFAPSQYLALVPTLDEFIFRPWGILTYSFMHADFMHILFNMLWLFFMGKVLVEYIGSSAFIRIYFIGCLAGGAAFLLLMTGFSLGGISTIPIVPLVGASAGVLAVVVAAGTLLPNNQVRLILIGPVKLKYIAIGALVLTTLLNFDSNTGGKIAHLGGALYGYYFVRMRQQGRDVGFWFTQLTNLATNLFKAKPKMKVAYKKTKSDVEYNTQKASEQKNIDAVLDKISKSGYESLTREEKDFLFKASNKK